MSPFSKDIYSAYYNTCISKVLAMLLISVKFSFNNHLTKYIQQPNVFAPNMIQQIPWGP